MKKALFLLLLATSLGTSAQLKVTSDGKVKIMSNQDTTYSTLLVGNNQFLGSASNIGISGSTPVMAGKSNIGIVGTISADPNITNVRNYGVLGVVSPVNSSNGINYGLCGMIGFTGDHYGGAGIYATNYTYMFSHPDNIQGDYAGFFHGPVYVKGYLTASDVFTLSDRSLNENVVSLNGRGEGTNTLDNLLAMNVIEYNMKSRIMEEHRDDIVKEMTEEERAAFEYLKKEEMKMSSRRHFGIDAEELQKIYPNLVLEGQDGYLGVNYVELVPVLIRAIQELKQELGEVKGEANAKAHSFSSESTDLIADATGNVLYQNTPNPFKEKTVIRFKLAENVQNAAICIFDMQGKMLKKVPISLGMESISIGGYELGEGMFLYSLIVNGKEVDTKRMILM